MRRSPRGGTTDCISPRRYHYPQSKWKSSADSKQYSLVKKKLTKKETGSQHFVLQLNHSAFFFCMYIYLYVSFFHLYTKWLWPFVWFASHFCTANPSIHWLCIWRIAGVRWKEQRLNTMVVNRFGEELFARYCTPPVTKEQHDDQPRIAGQRVVCWWIGVGSDFRL